MEDKDTSATEEPQKNPIRTIPVDPATLERVKALQNEFSVATSGGRVSQTVIANRAVSKVTLADLIAQVESPDQ